MENKFVITKESIGLMVLLAFIAIISLMFLLGIFMPDKKVSEKENRTLASFPKFTFSTYFSGEFNEGIEEYYSDNFPFRNAFLSVNDKLGKITSQFRTSDEDSIIVVQTGERDMGGQGIDDLKEAEE